MSMDTCKWDVYIFSYNIIISFVATLRGKARGGRVRGGGSVVRAI